MKDQNEYIIELISKNAALSKALEYAISELEKKECSFFLMGYLRTTIKENKVTLTE